MAILYRYFSGGTETPGDSTHAPGREENLARRLQPRRFSEFGDLAEAQPLAKGSHGMSIESPKSSPSTEKRVCRGLVRRSHRLAPAASLGCRLWPGVAIGLLWIIRLVAGLAATAPAFSLSPTWSRRWWPPPCWSAWWLFASRVSWADRGLVCGVFVLAAAATVMVSRQTFGMALILYAVPVILTVWVGVAVADLSPAVAGPPRGLMAALVLACGCFTLLRIDGMQPAPSPPRSACAGPRRPKTACWPRSPPLRFGPPNRQPPLPTKRPPRHTASAARLELGPGDWPGFRGAARDGRLSGVEIATDWQSSPPRQLWRHLIGPGWSSFAVIGNRVYTQEQRGDDEMVVCYDAAQRQRTVGTQRRHAVQRTRGRPRPAQHAHVRRRPDLRPRRQRTSQLSGRRHRRTSSGRATSWPTRGPSCRCGAFPARRWSSQGIVTVFAGGPESKSVLGYRAKTGELAWSAGEGTLSYCSTHLAHLDGVEQLLIATDVGLTAFQPETGEILWVHDWPTETVARIVQPALLGIATC